MRRSAAVLAILTLLTAGTRAHADESGATGDAAAPQAPTVLRSPATPGADRGRSWWAPAPDRGWLGVRLSTHQEAAGAYAQERLPDEWLAIPNLEWLATKWKGEGVLVVQVFPDSPAEKAGLLSGDVILSFNGIRTASPGVLAFIVQRVIVGHDGDIEVLRDGDTRRVLVEVGLHPEDARRLAEDKEAKAKAEAKAEARGETTPEAKE